MIFNDGAFTFFNAKLRLFVLILLTFFGLPTYSQSNTQFCDTIVTEVGKRVYNTVKLHSSQPKIDGNLSDICWLEEGYWSGNYRQFIPAEGAEPSQKTEIKILYDDQNVYVAIRAFDSEPDKIDRRIGRRDDFAGDIVGVCFDSYFDHRTGFEFDLTAAGSKLDLLLLNDSWDTNWNAVWHGKVGVEDSAWTAEMKIPLSQLRYGNKEEHVWGLHAWRWINRNQEEVQWNLMPRDNPGYLYSIGEIHGIKGISKARKIELLPYTLGKIDKYPKVDGNPYATGLDNDLRFGLDGKIGISSDFTMDFTINPDFGQVEADPAVLNLTAFEIFLEERRPFFLEGKNIFDFDFGDDLLFYSRRIGHKPMRAPSLHEDEYCESLENTTILGAIKLTGKSKNGLSVGIMESLTAREKVNITNTGDETRKEVVEPLTNYLVGRVQKDINESNTIIGGMFTATNRYLNESYLNGLNRNAFTGGMDFRTHWKNKTYFLDVKLVGSHIDGSELAIGNLQCASARYYQRPDADYLSVDSMATVMSGHGGSIEIGKGANGRLRYSADLNWRSPGLELNDVGFLQLADVIDQGLKISYIENDPKGIFRNYQGGIGVNNYWNFGGEYLDMESHLFASGQFKNKWRANAMLMRKIDYWDMRILRGGPLVYLPGYWFNRYLVSTDNSKKLAFRLGYRMMFFDNDISNFYAITPGFTYRVINSLEISSNINYEVRRTDLQYISEYQNGEEDTYLMGMLDRKTLGLTFRINYAISPDFTIQYYANPYISTGKYDRYKRILHPDSEDYAILYHIFDNSQLSYNENENTFSIDENTDGISEYTFDNPDFNFHQFRSNLVARWEYKPGSTVFFVWSHGRSEYEQTSDYSINNGYSRLVDINSQNVFLIKLNYWFEV